nr:hypothetical protein [Tanacetum cinerariifolium]
MTTLAEFMIITGANNRPPMLEKSLYDSWKSHMESYMENRENGRMILDSVQNGPLVLPTITEDDATNIVLQGLPPDMYAIFNHHEVAKEIWDRVKLLTRNEIVIIRKGFLPPEWSKFVMDVKLERDLHTTNYDQLYSYLQQHKMHANKTHLMRERYQDPLTEDLDAYDFDCDDVSYAKAALMANLFNYGSDVISERIKPTLYDGSVISKQHVTSLVFDDDETLILEEVSRSKMLAKQNDPISKEKKVNTTPINYAELNRLSEDFGKRFVPQQELSDEQAFWLQTSHPNTDQSASLPIKIEAPGNFLRRGMETLKDIFNVFDKDLLNEVTEVQTVFNQMEAAVQQYFVDK